MRPRNARARLAITQSLRAGPRSASQLSAALGVSPRTVLRLIDELGSAAIAWGAAGHRRYALRRTLRGHSEDIPLYVVDENGRASDAGSLVLVAPSGSYLNIAKLGWPVDRASEDGLWQGLPYPLYDMQPQGFLGRMFAKREHQVLEVPSDPRPWSDDDVVWVLSRRGADQSGNMILGDIALDGFQRELPQPAEPVRESATAARYVKLAEEVLALGLATSSAAGEFPKFTALRELPESRTPHVIVKFSGQEDSAATRRWADLLICEELALHHAGKIRGIGAASCRVLRSGRRTFIESERFDRHGRFGRSPLISLHALNGHLLGLPTQDWRAHAQALLQHKLIGSEQADAIRTLWWFGRLIANSDMHLGNLSFVPHDGVLSVAPAYDMLPMAYAPLAGGEVPPVQWRFDLPKPSESVAWKIACAAAIEFWRRASRDSRVSAQFRRICSENSDALQSLADRV